MYYARSDGGKEVALKLVRGNLEVEMRGMAQCLNLKHVNLLTLYDLKTDGNGDHWVVMEYIAGEPLSTVLNRHPDGLPQELAQQWFVALAKAVGARRKVTTGELRCQGTRKRGDRELVACGKLLRYKFNLNYD